MEWHEPPFKLKEIKFEVTHDCNLRCVHCSSLATEHSGRNLDWSSCNRILEDANKIGVNEIAFSGGEPLLWEPLKDAVSKTARFGMTTSLYTTGNVPRVKNILQDLYAVGLSRAIFSLFGGEAKQHENITRTIGSYKKTLSAASYCVGIGLETEFHFVPLSSNFSALQAIAEQARDMGVKRISVLRFVAQGRGAEGKNMCLDAQQNKELRGIIKRLRANNHQIRLGSPYNILMLTEKPQCCSGIDRLTIGPDLKIYPCDAFKHITPEAIGVSSDYSDLNNCSLLECWETSPFLRIVRNYLTTDFAVECQGCQKLKYCLSGCMAQKFYAFGQLKKCPDPMCPIHLNNRDLH